MTPQDPRHGTYAGVQAHRKNGLPLCDECRTARRNYRKRLAVDHARGRSRRVEIARMRAHIKRLEESGLPLAQIGRLAGLHRETVYRAAGRRGEGIRINQTAAAKILTVQPGDRTDLDRGYVPAFAARRRLQALVAIGHSPGVLAKRIGMSHTNMSYFLRPGAARPPRPAHSVQVFTDARVRALYAELAMVVGSSKRARMMAAQHGFPPPLAWDNIDDPRETPQGVGRANQPGAAA